MLSLPLFFRFHHRFPLHKLLGRFTAIMVEDETIGVVELSYRLHVISLKLEVGRDSRQSGGGEGW